MKHPAHLSEEILSQAQLLRNNYQKDLDVTSEVAALQRKIKTLSTIDLRELQSDNQKISFWLNTYNAYSIYLIYQHQVKGNLLHSSWIFFRQPLHVGGYRLTLNDIKHGILRCNQNAYLPNLPQFVPGERKRKLACQSLDYRIHFALSWGSASCPAINSYSAGDLDTQLDMAEYNYVKHNFLIDELNKSISASKIFKWYRQDFGDKYLNDPHYQDYKLQFMPFNWETS